ncbi:MAG: SDR family NAD(P)-dependent oxidoreductase [Pseudomonadota bacterium]
MDLRLDGRVALVTGASGGLGAHVAGVLAAAGARVVLGARRLASLEERAAAIGPGAMPVALDVTDDASVEAALDAAERAFGPVDVLVNNAGVVEVGRDPLTIVPDEMRRVLEVNVTGAFRLTQAVASRLVAAGRGGAVVNVASILGLDVETGTPAYCASKAALVQLTKQQALDLAPHRIRVNALAPGYVETDLNRAFLRSEAGRSMAARIPAGRIGRLEDFDAPLLLLASDAGAYITGAVLPVDGGHLVRGL